MAGVTSKEENGVMQTNFFMHIHILGFGLLREGYGNTTPSTLATLVKMNSKKQLADTLLLDTKKAGLNIMSKELK